MNSKHPDWQMPLYLLIFALWMFPSVSRGYSIPESNLPLPAPEIYNSQKNISAGQESLEKLNLLLRSNLEISDFEKCRRVTEKILMKIGNRKADENETLLTSFYLVGVYYLSSKNYSEALRFLEITARVKEAKNERDDLYARILYNMGIAYNGIGDFISQEEYSGNSLEVEKKLYGDSSPRLIQTYFNLVSACIGLKEYEKSLEYSKIVLNISGNNTGSVNISDLASIYNNLGVVYLNLSDYSKAKVYLENTESIYNLNHFPQGENYLSLINNMAITYSSLGLSALSNEYYEKGINLATRYNSSAAYNYINSYAITLSRSGNRNKGEELLRNAMIRAKSKLGEDSPEYFSALFHYADFLREFHVDNTKALDYYKLCLQYLGKNDRNLYLNEPLNIGYASSLAEKGDNYKALDIIQSLLSSDESRDLKNGNPAGLYSNPSIETFKTDKISLKILKLKYQILWKIYSETHDLKILETTSSTAELIVKVLEKVRINISEDDSRLILGDRYRDSYLNAIRDFNLLYRLTGDRAFLDRAFEYSEKSKVAGLLTATREMNASQFNIPAELSELEKKLKRDITFLSARIDNEINNEHPDTVLIQLWKEDILKNSMMKDSLVTVFEKEYPGYYSFKYNTSVTKLSEVPGIIGRNGNYINYVASDTMLYIFVVNRKKQQLLALPADSSLYADIREFRNLLKMPSPSGNAREAFERYQKTGYRLYQKIVEPIRPFLISKKLFISPDNILSYLPFETIPTSPSSGDRLLYNKIPYLMNEFDISYTYSVTFMAESMIKETGLSNKLIAFAPSYSEPINIGSVLMNRQIENGLLSDLPYAKQEAEYVTSVTDGKLYENEDARENVYKSESGKYDIIHLAMHTILNDKDPMYSTLIFSSENDSTEDRYLKTYEVYSIPLRAKMVVLSSCNSGTGFLYSGEGILSLARGFMYSGSESVVMAMWEIEDRSGTEIVKSFYDNLKKGYSKSSALRRARISYLRNADQLRSHPYFWSALVVYGNNSPLYYSRDLLTILEVAIAIILVSLGFYFWRRRYS